MVRFSFGLVSTYQDVVWFGSVPFETGETGTKPDNNACRGFDIACGLREYSSPFHCLFGFWFSTMSMQWSPGSASFDGEEERVGSEYEVKEIEVMDANIVPAIAWTKPLSKKRNRRRQQKSKPWHHQHWEFSEAAGKNRCNYCPVLWSLNSSSGTITKHLLEKHGLTSSSSSDAVSNGIVAGTASHQTRIPDVFTKISKTVERRHDSATVQYIVQSELPHTHAASESFKHFASSLAPGYIPKSARTIKRRILEMYIVLKQMMIVYFQTFSSKVSITFDGWSNSSLKGFFSVTLHWVCPEILAIQDCILDFFHVTSGKGCMLYISLGACQTFLLCQFTFPSGTDISTRVAQHLFEVLNSFELFCRLLATVSDNGSDAVSAAHKLALMKDSQGNMPLDQEYCLRCIVHTFDLAIKSVFTHISSTTATLRNVLKIIRGSKNKRQDYRIITKHMFGLASDPPWYVLTLVFKEYATFFQY